MMRSKAFAQLLARIDVMTKSMAHQSAAAWLQEQPDATARDLLAHLQCQAEEARQVAAEAEMNTGDLDKDEAVAFVARMTQFYA